MDPIDVIGYFYFGSKNILTILLTEDCMCVMI